MKYLQIDKESVPLQVGRTLLEHAHETREAYRRIAKSCDGAGTCRECLVAVLAGSKDLSPPEESESFLAAGDSGTGKEYRLACQAAVLRAEEDIVLETFNRRIRILEEIGPFTDVPLQPRVTRREERILIDGKDIGACGSGIFGLAIDVGTTTVVIELLDLETGRLLHVLSFENPQKYGGSSVIHRVAYEARRPGMLHETILAYVNHALEQLPVAPQSIYEIVVAGNSTMRDLFFGIDVAPLGRKPFKSATELAKERGEREGTSLDMRAGDLGIGIHPEGRVYGLPLLSSHVGADTAAGLLAIDASGITQPALFIDIGTNSEVVAFDGRRILAASCAAGPAFEGGNVRFGMPALEEAIDWVRVTNGRADFRTIGGIPPRGICGSGLVDALAEFREKGHLDEMGRLRNGATELPIAPREGISLSRRDISELSQVKGANLVGQLILIKRLGLAPSGIHTFHLAGGFAHAIDVEHAQEIGLIIPLPADRVHKAGNTSLKGARLALLSMEKRRVLEELVSRVEHVSLESDPSFFDLYVECMKLAPWPGN